MGRRREADTEKRTRRSGDAEKRGCVIDRCTGFSRVADAARIRTTALSAHPRVSQSPRTSFPASPHLPFSVSVLPGRLAVVADCFNGTAQHGLFTFQSF